MKKENESPLLSVCLITYNHVKYIEQAIVGVLMQQVNFPWELIIADDCSTDGAREILVNYQKQHPELIKLILQEENVGAYKNWMDLIAYPQSKYIAYLDGDDYWTDALKLQKQVDFLEVNPDYAICTHHVNAIENDISQHSPNLGLINEGSFTIEDLAKWNIIHSPSLVYRNGLIDEYPAWLALAPAGDYVQHMLNAKKGKIKYLPDTMAVYRQHAGGTWSAQPVADTLEKWIKVLSFLLTEKFDEKVIELLSTQKRNISAQYLIILLESDPELFKKKLDELMLEDPVLARELIINSFMNEHLELKEIRNKYYNLKNSRLRKYLSSIFKQLKME